jgi:alpha-1,6-mannosyltransferase
MMRLRLWIHGLGATIFAVHLGLALLSYLQAPLLWRLDDAPRAAAFFDSLGRQSLEITFHPSTWLSASRLFTGSEAVLLSYFIPLALASLAAMTMLLMLERHGEALDANVARLLRRWSIAFAIACFAAFPVFTQDLWLSAAWGRMIVAGVNPYHSLFTPEFLSGLPLDHFPMTMSYGPLWAAISALVVLLAWNNAIVIGLLLKALIAAAWIWALILIDRMHRDSSVRDRCLAIVQFGWVPLGVSQSVAEGHNDIAMIAPALLWLLLLMRGKWTAPVALTASVLCKYVTAPLFLIDLIAALRRHRLTLSAYVLRMVAPALIVVVLLALFARSAAFFDGLRLISGWHFLRPSEAVAGVEYLSGLALAPLHFIALAVFPVIAVYWIAVAVRDPSDEHLARAAVAMIAGLTFGALSHVWPWYLVWGVAFAALLPRWWLARFVTGVALLMPFALITWWLERFEPMRDVAALAIYAGAALWVVLTRPRSTRTTP